MQPAEQWAILRSVVQSDTTPAGATLLAVMNSREGRRDEVLAALEVAHDADVRSAPATRAARH